MLVIRNKIIRLNRNRHTLFNMLAACKFLHNILFGGAVGAGAV